MRNTYLLTKLIYMKYMTLLSFGIKTKRTNY